MLLTYFWFYACIIAIAYRVEGVSS